jgi:DNA-binding phage protein
MDKTKTSKKRQRSLARSAKLNLAKVPGLTRANPLKELTDPEKTGLAILECLQNNDPEGVMEMISIYLDALDKAQLRKKNKLPKSTMYSALKHRNPTIKTLAKIMHDSTR